jgi:quercetin dioxygenase-like cupin family protein
MDGPADRPLLLRTRPPQRFELRVTAVAPGHTLAYHETDWRDALVVVEHGEIELECLGGTRRRFGQGDVLWLVGLPLRALGNPGPEPAVLLAVSRRRGRSRAPPALSRPMSDKAPLE